MPAPKGHPCYFKNNGRPPKYDLEKEAADLLEWSLKPDSTAIYEFAYNKEYLVAQFDEFCDRSETFSKAYKKAKERVAKNRADKCSKNEMNYGVWAKSAAIYDHLLRQHNREEVEHKIDYEVMKKLPNSTPQNEAVVALVEKLAEENAVLRKELREMKEKSVQ